MNEEKFIELLNGYIDCELSSTEAAELEAEIAANPPRRATYEQYCRLHKACQTVLTARATIPRPSVHAIVAAARQPDNEIRFPTAEVRRPSRSGWSGFRMLTGGLIAASLTVMAVVNLSNRRDGDTLNQSGTLARSEAESHSAVQAASAYRTILTLDSFAMSQNEGRVATMLVPANDPFEWMRQVEFEPIERIDVNTLVFSNNQPIHVPNVGAYYPYPGLDDSPPQVEMTAFQFQR